MDDTEEGHLPIGNDANKGETFRFFVIPIAIGTELEKELCALLFSFAAEGSI